MSKHMEKSSFIKICNESNYLILFSFRKTKTNLISSLQEPQRNQVLLKCARVQKY